MPFYDNRDSVFEQTDKDEQQRREQEINQQYGIEEEEEDENWLKKIIEYLRQKKERDSQRVNKVV